MNAVYLSSVFEPYKDPRVDTLAPKLLFIALNLAAMALGVWKVKSDNLNYVVSASCYQEPSKYYLTL